ncbi:UNVERIFIED_CONTAM: hypothetical protein Sangu_3226500 [Sesamum angustifolium]|uniref:Uncharacterized protein n=1 Tax=Sesamum angustifolium TaxID=2727405 RepID=A0AAW2JK19_9LAMI
MAKQEFESFTPSEQVILLEEDREEGQPVRWRKMAGGVRRAAVLKTKAGSRREMRRAGGGGVEDWSGIEEGDEGDEGVLDVVDSVSRKRGEESEGVGREVSGARGFAIFQEEADTTFKAIITYINII